MKRQFFSAVLMGAMVVGATTSLQSCKDYDDDIQNLQQQIDANSKAIKAIEDLIQGGGVIKDVTSTAEGVTITMSNGKEFKISNGTNGADGTSWTIDEATGKWKKDGVLTDYKAIGKDGATPEIGTNGNWFINGSDTGVKASGKDAVAPTVEIKDGYWYINGKNTNVKATGENGTGTAGASGKYYVPNPNTKTFWVHGDGDKEAYDSGISYLGSSTVVGNGITAVLGKETLTLNGVEGVASGETVTISLSGNLVGLVYMPHLYLDGIEAYEYNWLQDSIMSGVTADKKVTNWEDKNVRMSAATNENKPYDYDPTNKEFTVSPVWGVQYHMNPSNANTVEDDVLGYNVLNPTAIYTTRATQSADVEYAKVNLAGQKTFFNSNGILTAGIKVNNPENLHTTPTDKYANDDVDVNTFALQVKTKDISASEGKVTSDYSMLVPTRSYLKALVWSDGESHNPGGENCPAVSKDVHIYDTPDKALKAGHSLEMSYASTSGIDLSKYVAIEYMSQNLKKKYKYERGVWTYGEQLPYGLTYEFNLVYYRVDGNNTVDSRYTKWVDKSKGQIRAWNVKEDGVTEDKESATSIGREPLVQILVKNDKGEVVLDGYILIKITDKPAEDQPNSIVDLNEKSAGEFTLCDAMDVYTMNWSEFSKLILTDHMGNMTKEDFEKLYQPDYKKDALGKAMSAGTNGDGNPMYYVNVYSDKKDMGDQAQEANQLGEVVYTPNYNNTTNDAFVWTLKASELESLTHHGQATKTQAKQVTRYIRYNAISPNAKWPYIYVKVTFNVTRRDVNTRYWGSKNDNYWYATDGAKNGWNALMFDIREPRDGENTNTYNRGIEESMLSLSTGLNKSWFFEGMNSDNRLATQPTHKYYFAPKDINITAQDGVTYTITAFDGTNTDFNKLVCLYNRTDKHNFYDAEGKSQLDATLNTCAINYNAGAFNNDKLYVKTGAGYIQIATLNTTTGVITLDKSKNETKLVLNAVGYMQNRVNMDKEMRTWVGIIAKDDCVAAKVADKDHAGLDGTFLASWTRPINVMENGVQQAVDANTNGNTIYVLDFLKMYDWRGYDGTEAAPDFSKTDANMWGDNFWYWVYYGVKAIEVDLTPAHVETTMHSGTWKKLSEITTKAQLVNAGSGTNDAYTYNFWSLISSYNTSADNAAIKSVMQANKKDFGAIVYYNNGDVVDKFSVKVPVTVKYNWGEFKTKVEIEINTTKGH